MKHILIYPVGSTTACSFAGTYLDRVGFPITDHPSPDVTHLLLDVPSFTADGSLRGGGSLAAVLERLPAGIKVIGGSLNHPALEKYQRMDLLQEPRYLARNAAITAECALRIAGSMLPTVFPDTPTLVIGWGRIGKCLAKLLSGLGCPVTIAARNPEDRAMAAALGYDTRDISQIPTLLPAIRLLFNTAPAPILGAQDLDRCKNCLEIDLASSPGLEGSDVIRTGGLPGRYAPESSGSLIAETILRHLKEETK